MTALSEISMPSANSFFEAWDELYQGARWVRTDFHLHTPDVHSFRCPDGSDPSDPEQKSAIVDAYVHQLVSQRIKLAAITDYNGIREEWFVPIRDGASQRGIVVLPGAELSFSANGRGLHVAVIFEPDADLQALNRTIHSVDGDPMGALFTSRKQHREIQPNDSVENTLRNLREQTKCLIIVVHPNDEKGLFKTYKAKQQAEFINAVNPDGIENFGPDHRHRLLNQGVREEVMQRIASVEFSDPKQIEEIGTKKRQGGSLRATCLKLSTSGDLDAIRIALHDGDVRACTDERPRADHTWIRGVEVEGSGFLGGIRLALSPELNTLIGGRGVGKSALLEAIRYGLGLDPYTTTEYRESLARHALGSGGKVTLYLDQVVGPETRRRYRIERIYGEEPRVYELNPERPVPLTPVQLFADDEVPLFFGQKEIYAVTQEGNKRLRLLDQIIGRSAQEQQRALAKTEEDLRRNARSLLDLAQRLEEKTDAEERLHRIEHELAIYQKQGVAEKLKQATQLSQDEVRLKQQRILLDEAAGEWARIATEVDTPLQRAPGQAARAQSVQRLLVQDAAQVLGALRESFASIIRTGDEAVSDARRRLDEIDVRWRDGRAPLDEEIRRVKQEIGESDLDLDNLERLTQEQTHLKGDVERLAALADQQRAAQSQREELLRALQEQRYQVFALRQNQAKIINERLKGRVRLDVSYKGQCEPFTERIASLLQDSGVRKRTIEEICSRDGDEVVAGPKIAAAVRRGVEGLQEEFGLSPGQAGQIHSWLTGDPTRLYEIELMMPEDQVQVYLKVDDEERELSRLSGGQQATAMLLLLLVQEKRPLFVDQPEEDLDNRFIYDDIVRILREQKGKRQFVFATHNANIPVTADAELIVALEAEAGHGYIAKQGGIDRPEVREAVKQIMEGGEQALRRRTEKYGWLSNWRPAA